MHDLSKYAHRPEYIREGLLRVGWLERPQGDSGDQELAERLAAFLPYRVARSRGLHICPPCRERFPLKTRNLGLLQVTEPPEFQKWGELLLGSAEFRVFGAETEAYACPDLIVHYVAAHQYRPPLAFLEALERGPAPGSPEYLRRLIDYTNPEDHKRLEL